MNFNETWVYGFLLMYPVGIGLGVITAYWIPRIFIEWLKRKRKI